MGFRVFSGAICLLTAAVTCMALLFSAPARAGYCEDQYSGPAAAPYNVRGACRVIRSFRIEGVTPSTLDVWVDQNVIIPDSTLASILSQIEAVASRVGPKLRELHGPMRLPARINVVIISARHPVDGSANAETFRVSSQSATDPTHQCPILLFRGVTNISALRRTLSHELMHCAQYETLPGPTTQAGREWWMEGSAEWFEDFVFPEDIEHANTREAIRVFNEHSAHVPLIDAGYSAVVFFAWLHQANGARAIGQYMWQMAVHGQSQADALRNALPGSEYHRFAQAYVDDEIRLPSGVRVEGALLPALGTTTGEPGADPDIQRSTPRPMTIQRGTVEIVPGGYRPKGSYGDADKVFSERRGEWKALPPSLLVRCGERKTYRFAAMSVAERPPEFKLKPGTDKAMQCGDCGATGGEVRRAGCIVGSWRMVSGGNCDMLGGLTSGMPGVSVRTEQCDPGQATGSFNRNGSFEGILENSQRRVSMTFSPRGRRGEPSVMTMETIIRLAKGAGLWSAQEETGDLRFCSTTTTGIGHTNMSGMEQAEGRMHEVTRPLRFGPVATVNLKYTCSGDNMTITVPSQGSGMGDFSIQLQRMAPPSPQR